METYAQLIDRAVDGNGNAFGEVPRRHQLPVYSCLIDPKRWHGRAIDGGRFEGALSRFYQEPSTKSERSRSQKVTRSHWRWVQAAPAGDGGR